MQEPYQFQQDELVKFEYGPLVGEGLIKGAASIQVAITGRWYIVQVTKTYGDGLPVPNEHYPFDTITLPEISLTK